MLFENVLVLAPHTDDGELGSGGFISKLLEQESKVTYVAFSTAESSVPEHLPRDILKTEVKNATEELGILSENLIILDYEVRKLNYSRQEILEDLIIAAINDAKEKGDTLAQEEMKSLTGGLPLPPGMKLPF